MVKREKLADCVQSIILEIKKKHQHAIICHYEKNERETSSCSIINL